MSKLFDIKQPKKELTGREIELLDAPLNYYRKQRVRQRELRDFMLFYV